jgi:hypothetical protein
MAKEIVLRFDAINKRQGGILYCGPTKETSQNLPRSGLVLLTLMSKSIFEPCRLVVGVLVKLNLGPAGFGTKEDNFLLS